MTAWRDTLEETLGSSRDLFQAIIRSIEERGGKTLIVGGWVRDLVRGAAAENLDLEVYGIEPRVLTELLTSHGKVETIGEAFGILKVHGLDVDFSIPRRESKTGLGHKGFEVLSDPRMSPFEAARRRDLTINAMALDLATGEIIDPFGGRNDIDSGILRATDPQHFVEDPLRVYRAAQFAARLEYAPTPELVALCSQMTPEGLPPERILAEFDRLLLEGRRPSVGLTFLKDCGWIKHHGELEALIGCRQEDEWHPEGDVWKHTLLVVDAAAGARTGLREEDRLVMYAALCHDLGKAATTRYLNGRIRSLGHCMEGETPTRHFLGRLTREESFITGVIKLVTNHLIPDFLHGAAGPAAIRRLARRLEPEVNIDLLVKVARADRLGTGHPAGSRQEFQAGDWLLERADELAVKDAAEPPVLMGRHLIAAGLKPGPLFGDLLGQAYEIQTSEGIRDIDTLLSRVLNGSNEGLTHIEEDADGPTSVPPEYC